MVIDEVIVPQFHCNSIERHSQCHPCRRGFFFVTHSIENHHVLITKPCYHILMPQHSSILLWRLIVQFQLSVSVIFTLQTSYDGCFDIKVVIKVSYVLPQVKLFPRTFDKSECCLKRQNHSIYSIKLLWRVSNFQPFSSLNDRCHCPKQSCSQIVK